MWSHTQEGDRETFQNHSRRARDFKRSRAQIFTTRIEKRLSLLVLNKEFRDDNRGNHFEIRWRAAFEEKSL